MTPSDAETVGFALYLLLLVCALWVIGAEWLVLMRDLFDAIARAWRRRYGRRR